jgi:TDG/mug DNA glycosylase family protein
MTKPLLFCFEPVADSNSEILILGSMPGQESLAASQYYANRRNAFWKILAELLEFDPNCSYDDRVNELKTAHIALWDVLKSCTRAGSLDAKIDAGSITVNDFQGFFRRHDKIHTVFFNGAKAESTYRQFILPTAGSIPVSYIRLPSTSPAHASLSYGQKLQAWQAVTIALNRNKTI